MLAGGQIARSTCRNPALAAARPDVPFPDVSARGTRASVIPRACVMQRARQSAPSASRGEPPPPPEMARGSSVALRPTTGDPSRHVRPSLVGASLAASEQVTRGGGKLPSHPVSVRAHRPVTREGLDLLAVPSPGVAAGPFGPQTSCWLMLRVPVSTTSVAMSASLRLEDRRPAPPDATATAVYCCCQASRGP